MRKRKMYVKVMAVILSAVMLLTTVNLNAFRSAAGNVTGDALSESGWDYAFEAELNGTSVDYLDEAFDVYQYQRTTNPSATGSEVGPVKPTATNPNSEGSKSYFTTEYYGGRSRGGLKPTSVPNNGYTMLTYNKGNMVNFEAEYEFYAEAYMGLTFGGEAGKFQITQDGNNSNDTAVALCMEANGGLCVYGAIDTNNVTASKGVSAAPITGWTHPCANNTANLWVDGLTGTDTIFIEEYLNENSKTFTVCVKVQDGVLTVYEKNHADRAVSVKLSENYQSGPVSLFHTNTHQGAFKSFGIRKIENEDPNPPEPDIEQAKVGDGFASDFTTLPLAELNASYNSFYFENAFAKAVEGSATERWTTGTDLADYEGYYQNWWLKPMHKSEGQYSLLSYKQLSFKNVDVTAEYVTNHLQYGIMIAPKGKLAAAGNGVKVWVEGNGTIMITGAVDGATGTAVGGQVKIFSKNILGGFPINGYVAPVGNWDLAEANKTSYKLHVRIAGKAMSVWLEEYPDYIISVNLTDDYEGGVLSLYASGYNQGAFKNIKAEEIEDYPFGPDENTIIQSFNTIDSPEELKENFAAYLFTSVDKKAKEKNLSELFKIADGRLMSNMTEDGDEETNLAALTLKNKSYKNFELTLKYEQSGKRYGVMFGTEADRFAYTKKGNRLVGSGGIFAYTDAEGGRHIKGSMDASFYNNAKEVRCFKLEDGSADFYAVANDQWKTIDARVMHTLTIRVVGDYMTMVSDNDEATRVTVRIPEYEGGYISLITNAGSESQRGAFCHVAVKELGEGAELDTQKPEITNSFSTMQQVEDMFDAYHLEDASVSNKLNKVNLEEHWWLGNDGFIARTNEVYSSSLTEDVDILTYTKQKYTDFELTYSYRQSWQRLGIMLGTELGEYPLSINNKKLQTGKGSIFFMEAEGNPILTGQAASYTDVNLWDNVLFYRVENKDNGEFVDATGNASANVNGGKIHTVKIVVKDKQLYAFIDGSDTPCLYTKLGDDYNGGYVSLLAHARADMGLNNFSITDKVTTKLPKAGGVSSQGNTFTADFNHVKFDSSDFTAYFMKALKKNENGSMTKKSFEDMWTVANGSMTRHKFVDDGSDGSNVAVLTYNKRLTDFVVTYDYQKYDKALMLMFGAEKGKYPLCNKGYEDLENGGVIVFPENDLGVSGGIVALGGVNPLTESYRPLAHQKVTVPGYHVANWWESNFGAWHTMTVAVVNRHCYIYLDDYGLIDEFDLLDDYNGGYISLAAAGSRYGFDNLKITDLSSLSGNSIVSAVTPRDLTVPVGTELSSLALPGTIDVTLKNGTKTKVAVDWVNMNYDPSTVGIYKLTAVPKTKSTVINPAKVAVTLTVRVVEQVKKARAGVREWTFDTADDLKDFKQYYFKDDKTGFQKSGEPQWFVSSRGTVQTDLWRTPNGDLKRDLAILTYAGEKYKNFELEVDYTQNWGRTMVMFGTEKVGTYMDLEKLHEKSNPVLAFVEMEGVRNFVGNVKNTNYYARLDENIYEARENGVRLKNYYEEGKMDNYIGTVHKMKIRVVGNQASMWVDDNETPMTIALTDYDGGYISLVSTRKGSYYDNLRITRLNEEGKPAVTDPKAVANGYSVVSPDENASTEMVKKSEPKPKQEPVQTTMNYYVIGGGILLAVLLIGTGIILLVAKRRKGLSEKRGVEL